MTKDTLPLPHAKAAIRALFADLAHGLDRYGMKAEAAAARRHGEMAEAVLTRTAKEAAQ